jgi:hypothetical protein
VKAGQLTVIFHGSKNMPLFLDLFLRDSHLGNAANDTKTHTREEAYCNNFKFG